MTYLALELVLVQLEARERLAQGERDGEGALEPVAPELEHAEASAHQHLRARGMIPR